MSALIPLNRDALAAFQAIEADGLDERTKAAVPFLAAYRDATATEVLLEEFRHIEKAGQTVDFDVLDGTQARALEPALSSEIVAAIMLKGERFLDPPTYVQALGRAVQRRGGTIRTSVEVNSIRDVGTGVVVADERYDAVVIASGARFTKLARDFGVKRLVQAGRGYSFSVTVDNVPRGPVYFPAQRVACTPVGDRLRVAGMMEFRPVDAPLDPRRISAIRDTAAPLLTGVDMDDRRDEWVGSRPCTVDGLPLVGRTRNDRVFAAGGHGMWGMTLGPVTAKLLAEQITSGRTPEALRPLDPLR